MLTGNGIWQLKLAIIDTLSTPFNANLVPSLSAQIMADYDKTNSKYKNGNNNKNSNKRQRKSYFRSDPRQEASYNIIRHFMTGLLKDTLMAVTARNIAVSGLTQVRMLFLMFMKCLNGYLWPGHCHHPEQDQIDR